MSASLINGERVVHYRHGKGIVERLIHGGIAEVRFGNTLVYVQQTSLKSLEQEEKKKHLESERRRKKNEKEKQAKLQQERADFKKLIFSHLAKFDFKQADATRYNPTLNNKRFNERAT
jgi:hypothetical protein